MDGSQSKPPRFESPEVYGASLSDVRIWRPLVYDVLARHQMDSGRRELRMGTAGTFPTVLVDDAYAIKFFGPRFDGQASAAVEHDIYKLLAADPTIPAPSLIQSGTLDTEDAEPWHYIISSQMPGASYGTVRERLAVENRRDVAQFIAEVATSIHRLIPFADEDLPPILSPDWNDWHAFMASQTRRCSERHRAWGTLPGHLVEQIKPYFSRLPTPLVHTEPPVLLHGDLTLGNWQGETWSPTGIIDFGDARVGDPFYELVALHIECFGRDKDLLRVFLDGYGLRNERPPDFAYRAMRMTLLHEFNVLETVFSFMPQAREMTTLDHLAKELWDVNV